MFVGPDHPMFDGRRGGVGGMGGIGGRGPWGGDGFLPPMGAPPGARFDPIGPGSFPGSGGFGGLPGRGNRHGPDNDEFMPPGAVSTHPKAAASARTDYYLYRVTCTCNNES